MLLLGNCRQLFLVYVCEYCWAGAATLPWVRGQQSGAGSDGDGQ